MCEHRTLFPLRPLEIGGFVVYTITAFFSNFSGIAGALPLIAIISLQKFNMKNGIMLSNAQICSAGIARLAMDGNKTHPLRKTHGILLDYSMLTMMLPMITLGSALATLVARIMPDFYIVLCYAIIMIGILAFNLWRLSHLIKKEKYLAPALPARPTEQKEGGARLEIEMAPVAETLTDEKNPH